eukprot:923189-Pyramimonas_sp.AAC.1
MQAPRASRASHCCLSHFVSQAAVDWAARAPRRDSVDDAGGLQFVDGVRRGQVHVEPAVDVSADVRAAVEW